MQIPRDVNAPSIQLTAKQLTAVQELSTYVRQKMPSVLFWAVTGAGKTETMIPVIEPLIRQGKSVLWCTPRQDVVKELAPRLKRFFPDGIVSEHYAGSPDKWMLSPLVIATAHQTIRMAHLFDLVIVDEADAFPLEGNPALEYSIQRSKRTGGTIVLLTATPTDLWIYRMRKGILPTVLLPCRFHGKLMPCPIWKRERALWAQIKSHKMNRTVQRIISEITSTDGQALWFVPRIEDTRVVGEWLKRQFLCDEGQVDFVSSTDENRTGKIMRFRDGNILHLVTTTILERGITVPKCNAVVLGADHSVYDRASLVQIAGRVGRSLQYQAGKVWFISNHKTEPICQAIREIQLLNREACKEFGG
ncbi:competence protein ComFA [Thermoactinomyces sp. DSM 45891]|nr:competence protein ComFA [Thermoactinomyces sp. DSM 45891]